MTFWVRCDGCGEELHGLTDEEYDDWWREHPSAHFGGFKYGGSE